MKVDFSNRIYSREEMSNYLRAEAEYKDKAAKVRKSLAEYSLLTGCKREKPLDLDRLKRTNRHWFH